MSFFIFPFLKNKTSLSESALSEVCLCVIKEYALNREKLIERLISEIGADSILTHIGRIPDEERFFNPPIQTGKRKITLYFPNITDEFLPYQADYQSKNLYQLDGQRLELNYPNDLVSQPGVFDLSRIYGWPAGTVSPHETPKIEALSLTPIHQLPTRDGYVGGGFHNVGSDTLYPLGEMDDLTRIKHYADVLLFRLIIGDSVSHADLIAQYALSRLNHVDYRFYQGEEFFIPPNHFFNSSKSDISFKENDTFQSDEITLDPKFIQTLKEKLSDFMLRCAWESEETSVISLTPVYQKTQKTAPKGKLHPLLTAIGIVGILMLLRGR